MRAHSGRHTSICGRGAPPDLLLSLPFCLVSVKAPVPPLPSLHTERHAFAEMPSINYAAGAVHARRGTELRTHARRHAGTQAGVCLCVRSKVSKQTRGVRGATSILLGPLCVLTRQPPSDALFFFPFSLLRLTALSHARCLRHSALDSIICKCED